MISTTNTGTPFIINSTALVASLYSSRSQIADSSNSLNNGAIGSSLVLSGSLSSLQYTATTNTGTPFIINSTALVSSLYSARSLVSDSSNTFNGSIIGPITITGTTSSITSQTGLGSIFVIQNGPTLITPYIGAAVAASFVTNNLTANGPIIANNAITVFGSLGAVQYTSTITTAAPFIVNSSALVGNLYSQRSIVADNNVLTVSGTGAIVSTNGLNPVISISVASSNAAGSMSANNMAKMRLFIDPIADYGAKFNHRVVFDGATTANSATITSTNASFTSADVGRSVNLTGAATVVSGNPAGMLLSTILVVNSSTSITIAATTNITVSNKGLQIFTDDTSAWLSITNDVNNSVYPGAVIKIETPNGATPFGASGFTGRSAITAPLTFNKQISLDGYGSTSTADIGDYSKGGGCCLAYAGVSILNNFNAVMTIAPSVGITAQNLKAASIRNFWIDCRNGDGNYPLIGLSLQSCTRFNLENFFIMDAGAIGLEMTVVGPGYAVPNALSLGEAKDCTRGVFKNIGFRMLEAPATAMTAPATMTSVSILSTTGQTLTVSANTLPISGYFWTATNCGYPVLVNYTGGGSTTSLTSCTVSPTDSINSPTTVATGNIVQAIPLNGCSISLDGDLSANTCLNHFDTVIISHGSTVWGPAAIETRNSDSNVFTNVVINGGSSTNLGLVNRIQKPGMRMNGSAVNYSYSSRNNVFENGSAGAGGLSQMGFGSTGGILVAQAGPSYYTNYQLGNGEPIPNNEANCFFEWNPNGGFGSGISHSAVLASTAGQLITSTTTNTAITGSIMAIPPQGIQLGSVLRWTIICGKSAAGTAARTFAIKVGTTSTSSDTTIQSFSSAAGTGVADTAFITIVFTINATGTIANGTAILYLNHVLAATGFATTASQTIVGVPTSFNATTQQLFISLSLLPGTAEIITVSQCFLEIVKSANP